MTKYDVILFDADDTLLDFQKAERTALSEVFKSYGIDPKEDVLNRYMKINDKLWKRFERGEIAKEDILNNRFTLLFQELSLDEDGIKCNDDYLEALGRGDFLLEGALEAIKKINASGYLAIVVTNQPVIARGEVTVEELQQIHNKMETLLGNDGAFVDAIYYCPHHPDSGFEGEIPELKIKCECRKPNPGMLLQAAEEFNIDLEQSWMVGDSHNDVLAGLRAGCKTAYITAQNDDESADLVVSSLLDFVERILC